MADNLRTKLSALRAKDVLSDVEYGTIKAALLRQRATKWVKEDSGLWRCPNCRTTCGTGEKSPLEKGINYCPKCGQRLWEA